MGRAGGAGGRGVAPRQTAMKTRGFQVPRRGSHPGSLAGSPPAASRQPVRTGRGHGDERDPAAVRGVHRPRHKG
jgi:hypothetical protein